ncbi:TD and POZ domain-containing protein 5 [Trichonephila clavipes]|nr:TD and POZ domain-containing protein 5 [Trichonephila clavipes]
MALPNYNRKSTCTFLWKIENVNYLWLKISQYIESPVFVVDELENTEWHMRLYPRGENRSADKIGFFLYRKDDGSGTDDIDVYFELAFLSESGKTLCSALSGKRTCKKGSSWGFNSFQSREVVFVTAKSNYLPSDTLTAQCKIWRCDGKVGVYKHFLAGTRVAIEKRSFQWEIEKFSTIGCNEKKHFVIRSGTSGILMTFDLYFTGGQLGEEVIDIGIRIFKPNAKYVTFKTFVRDNKGEFENCGMKEFVWEGCEKKGIITLSLAKNHLQGKDPYSGCFKYLNDDVLSLYCECIFSTRIASETIESVESEIASLKTTTAAVVKIGLSTDDEESEDRLSTDNEESEDRLSTNGEESVVGLPTDYAFSLREDLGSLCSSDDLSDMKLRTNTTTIPVHTQILGARSSVFKAMFVNDMKEKTQRCVDVTDVDDDTVRRLLLYMYTDKLEDLPWQSMCQLHAAADKYDVASLRNKCSAILQAKLSPTNACQILSLADMHQDKVLKKTIQKYLLKQGKIIFSSEEWKSLMDTNLRLAAETMHINWNEH